MKKKVLIISIISIILAVAIAIVAIFVFKKEKPDFSGLTLKIYSSIDISAGSYLEGAKNFEEEFGCKVEFTDNFEECDLFYSSGEDFSQCMPLNDYINPRSNTYTKSIMDQCCTEDGKIYGLSHTLLGKINYCVYNPDQFDNIKLPYDYYESGDWTWDNFLIMSDELNSNVAVDWNSSYINMMHSLFLDENNEPTFDYDTQEQVEWLNFVRALIYDRGIVDNSEGAYKVGFLPQLVLDNVESGSEMRYIAWPTKTGKDGTIFVDEYHFCVPKFAKNPGASVELANCIINSCVDTRMALYEENMTPEDFELFKKQIKNVYCYPYHTDYVPASEFINDFIRGKTVSEHIFNVKNGAEHIK